MVLIGRVRGHGAWGRGEALWFHWTRNEVIWVCNNCRKQQELLTKPGEWFCGPEGGKPPGSDVSDKKLRSRSQAPPASSAPPTDDPNRLCAPTGGTALGIDGRSRSEPPRDTRNGRGGGVGRGERRPGPPRLKAQVSVDRHLRGNSRERREGRRLTKGRSLEHDPVGADGAGAARRPEDGGYHHMDHPAGSNPALPRQHLGTQQQQQQQQQQPPHAGSPGAPGGRGHPLPIRGGTVSVGFEAMARVGAAGPPGPPMAPKQRTAGGVGAGGLHEHTSPSQPGMGPPELREPSGPGPGSGSSVAAEEGPPPARRSKREKAESMLRNDSLSSDQSESLRPPPPRPYKSKRGMGGAGGKRQTSVSSSEEEGGTTPEYSSCEDAEIESVSERGSSSFESQKMDRPSISVQSPSCTGLLRNAPQLMPGQISAVELPLRPDGRPRSLYVKMYFLPDRSDKSKRRTKTVKRTTEPKWSQTFVYTHVHRRDFRNHMLELTVWDQPRMPDEDSSFMGEILIELETAP
ncbi:hypothetical protein CRUP_025896, partial [Coryphaenoides rupestris]